MTFLEALFIGLVQGLTEFLPISSSGHIMLAEHLLGYEEEPNLLLNVVLHLGTLAAVILFYRKDVLGALTGILEATRIGLRERSLDAFREREGARLAILIVLAMIPTAVLGLALRPFISASALEDVSIVPILICTALVFNGFILFSARFFTDEKARTRQGAWTLWNITPAVALLIGVAQGIAVIPGFSRSGLTIMAALWLSVHRVEAARFSFLLSIPAVAAAMLVESATKFDATAIVSSQGLVDIGIYAAAALLAGFIGYLSILLLVNLLKKAHFWHFAWYCWAVGLAGLAYLLL
jgi:undecaprenyl-diphosphatase